MTRLVVAVVFFVFSGVVVAQTKKASDFQLKTADGKTVQLSQFKGKVLLLNFWATWCGPCRKEIPDFVEVYKQYRGKGFEIVGVALDEDGWKVVNPFVKQYGISYPIVLGNGKVVSAYGNFEYIPTTFLIDKRGTIVHTFTGLVKKEELERLLKTLL